MTNTISDRRIEANRRNAQLSTGPRTPAGKARVAQNRITHALTAATHIILPGEDAAAYHCLLTTLIDEHAPVTETEAHQVELLAHGQWRLRRAARLETEAFEDSLSPETGRFALTDAVMRAARYMASIRRSYSLALAELHRLRSAREKAAQSALVQALNFAFSPPPSFAPDDSNPIGITQHEPPEAEPDQPRPIARDLLPAPPSSRPWIDQWRDDLAPGCLPQSGRYKPGLPYL